MIPDPDRGGYGENVLQIGPDAFGGLKTKSSQETHEQSALVCSSWLESHTHVTALMFFSRSQSTTVSLTTCGKNVSKCRVLANPKGSVLANRDSPLPGMYQLGVRM